MPIATRLQAHARSRSQRLTAPAVEVPPDEATRQNTGTDVPMDQQVDEDDQVGDEEDDEEDVEGEPEVEPFPPPGLKEISSLASWTVSTAKPGNGVAALRSLDMSQFWQSDGPQPHLLSIHFFKLVSIVHMRIYLDFVNDESYTPTKIQFLAGMGVHDIQEFAEMSFEHPNGWIDVDFSNVGPIESDDDEQSDTSKEIDWNKRPVLRAFLVQVQILENHQNGKDTHLRGVQLFARDDTQEIRQTKRVSPRKTGSFPMRSGPGSARRPVESNNIKLAEWMLEPDLR